MSRKRILKGFAIAPLFPSTALLFLAIVMGDYAGTYLIIMLIFPISYITSFFVGYPVYLTLRKIGRQGLVAYGISGFLAAFVPIFIVLIYPHIAVYGIEAAFEKAPSGVYKIASAMIFFGIITALVFWFVARPDRMPQHAI